MAVVRLNKGNINQALGQSLNKAAVKYDRAFRRVIKANLYFWPRPTIRSNDELVFSPRNIIDTGDFQNSQSYEVNGLRLMFMWDIGYAALILFGYTTRSELEYPARNWINKAQDIFDFEEIMGEACQQVFR